jgi:hypothetical protein
LCHRLELLAELAAESSVPGLYRRAVVRSAEQSCGAPALRQPEHSQLERTAKRMWKPTELLRAAARLMVLGSQLEAWADAEVARPPAFPLPEMSLRAVKELRARRESQKLAELPRALGLRVQLLLAGLLRRAKRPQASLMLDELLAEQPRAAVLPVWSQLLFAA